MSEAKKNTRNRMRRILLRDQQERQEKRQEEIFNAAKDDSKTFAQRIKNMNRLAEIAERAGTRLKNLLLKE